MKVLIFLIKKPQQLKITEKEINLSLSFELMKLLNFYLKKIFNPVIVEGGKKNIGSMFIRK